jgi:hypothetical protein
MINKQPLRYGENILEELVNTPGGGNLRTYLHDNTRVLSKTDPQKAVTIARIKGLHAAKYFSIPVKTSNTPPMGYGYCITFDGDKPSYPQDKYEPHIVMSPSMIPQWVWVPSPVKDMDIFDQLRMSPNPRVRETVSKALSALQMIKRAPRPDPVSLVEVSRVLGLAAATHFSVGVTSGPTQPSGPGLFSDTPAKYEPVVIKDFSGRISKIWIPQPWGVS